MTPDEFLNSAAGWIISAFVVYMLLDLFFGNLIGAIVTLLLGRRVAERLGLTGDDEDDE